MTGTFGRRRLPIGLWAWTIVFAATFSLASARADTVTVSIDQARVMKLPDNVSTIVIGNPLIADATLQSGGILVVTGKGFGETNMLALDRKGAVVMNETVQVLGPASKDLVVVYKGNERESYSCAPDCERRITLGDAPVYFNATLNQSGTRTSQAATAQASR
jgi:hypothetical protein